jgi:hypothetical protein
MPSSLQFACTAVAISLWPGESLKKRVIDVFGFCACESASFAASMSPLSGV